MVRFSQSDTVTKFKLPNVNYKTKVQYDLVDWKNIVMNEPPLSNNYWIAYKSNEIRKMIEDIPSHTQAMGRGIKHVIGNVSGEEARNSEIYSKIELKRLLKSSLYIHE